MSKIEEALNTIKEEMTADHSYAWAWHCNLAMMAVDAGAPHVEANIRSADLMESIFGIDVRELNEYKAIVNRDS